MIVYQTENLGKSYEYRTNPHQNWVMPPHLHEFSEIAYTLEGVTTVFVDGQRHLVPKDHLIFILPNQIHEYSDETASVVRCAVFSNDHIPAFFDKIKKMRLAAPVLDLTHRPQLLRELESTDPQNTLRLCGLLSFVCEELLAACPLVPDTAPRQSLLRRVVEQVSLNFCEDIRLSDLAKRLGYHEKYLSTTLHALTGMNFRTFLSSYRINYAKHLLRVSDGEELRVAEIALQCGFASINSFNRVFRQLTGVTPTAYRAARGK